MATTMQSEIPWNVAGIAPEAREAARTSARREGLSVGEWLTRRILRGLPEPGAEPEEWWLAENTRTPSNENPFRNGHEQNHDGLRSRFQQPHESRPRAQSLNAPDFGAAPIKFPARSDSQNIEQLNDRLVRLDARIARVEIKAAAEEAKSLETVKGVQAKLAELTEQISRAAAHSAAKDTQLAKAIAAVTEKFMQASVEADEQRGAMYARIEAIADHNSAVDARIATLAEDDASMNQRLETAREDNERKLRGVDDRAAATEIVVEAFRRDAIQAERLGGSLDQLTRRFETAEAEYLNNIERFEGRLTLMEASSGETTLDRRLQSIEQALGDMTRLIEKNAPEKSAAVDAPEKSGPAGQKSETVRSHDLPPFAAGVATPILDLPPFPEKPKGTFVPAPESAPAPISTADLRASAPAAHNVDDTAKRPITAEVESLLAAARRNARAGNPSQPLGAPFSWIDVAAQKKAGGTHTRLILLGGLALLVLAAVGMGFYLSNAEGPGIANITARPANYAVAANARGTVPVQPRGPKLASPSASPAKPVSAVPAPDAVPVRTATASRSQPMTVQSRVPPPATAIGTTPAAAASAKPLAPLQRLTALANAGHAKAEEVLGLAYLDGDGVAVSEAEGAKWLQRAAAGGEAVAAYRLGTLYERGHGVAADAAKATHWYAVAAKAGNRKAMHNLAVAYAQGSGVQKDLALAAQWFSRAASLGLADSEFNLAVLYERGLGIPQNLGEAYKWYAIAAAQGDVGSRSRMDAIAPQLSANDKAAAEKSAAQFQPAPLDQAANAPPVAASLAGGA